MTISADKPHPRPAATVLLMRDNPFEVLMVERHASGMFASALVFPGGVADPDDASPEWLPHLTGIDDLSGEERRLRVAAARETFEETGILLAEEGTVDLHREPELRRRPFLHIIRERRITLALDRFHKIGHWITPEGAPKRYDTHFYIALAPAGQAPVCDGEETVSLEWLSPAKAISLADAGARHILFPTRMNLTRLADSPDTLAAIHAARAKPPFTVTPRMTHREDGSFLCIPAEAGYGVTEIPVPGRRRQQGARG